MSQSKRHSHYEILTNQIAGIIIGWLIVYFAFPHFDYLDQGWVATISTILFFIFSYIRGYTIRRIYDAATHR